VEHPSAERLDDALLKEFPDSAVAQDRTAQRLALRGEVDESLAAFDRLLRQRPEYDPARFSRALVLERAGRFEELIAFAEREIPRVSDTRRPALLEVLGHAYARLGDTAGVSRIVGSHRRLVAGTARGLAESYALEGQLELELDHPGAAFAAFREAYRINKGTPYLVTIAQIAQRLGDHRQQLWAYTRLCEENPTNARFCSERSRLIDPQR
jgi:tetratricopeptide (TPR) repeat protein